MTPEEREAEQRRKPLSPSEAAAYFKEQGLNISQRTVDRMVKRGELDAFVTVGGWQRIRRSELDRWIEEHS
jgi:excisionase family DNA binding protein